MDIQSLKLTDDYFHVSRSNKWMAEDAANIQMFGYYELWQRQATSPKFQMEFTLQKIEIKCGIKIF